MIDPGGIDTPKKPPARGALLVGFAVAWGLVFNSAAAILEPGAEHFALAASIWSAGLYTVILWATRRLWLPWTRKHPRRSAVVVSVLSAVVVETEFLVFERVFGAQGIAAHPNLLADLALTLPWYIPMAISFVSVQDRRRFSSAAVLFLGAVYELGADGIVGPLMEAFSGTSPLFTAEYWLMMLAGAFWGFIPVYSSLVLPPAWILSNTDAPPVPRTPAAISALKPLLWLIPFALYLVLVLWALGAIPGAAAL